jgi:hypothetical protein
MKIFFITVFAAIAAAAPVLKSRSDAPYGDKKGLAYNDGSITSLLSQPGSATWSYNWGTALDAPLFQQIPMKYAPGNTGDYVAISAAIKAGSPWVLGYNEPDMTTANGGTNISPQDAWNAWGDDMFQFLNQGAKLVCPAITSDNTATGATGRSSGLTWLKDFANVVNDPAGLNCSAQALHWYGVDGQSGADQAQLFISYIEEASSTVNGIFGSNMLLWITEFSPLPVHDAQVMSDFLAVAMPWLDTQDYVDRYSPFMAEDFVLNGGLSVAGNTFVHTK